ncbi:MAG: DUF1631 domain-containing protein [Cellvibrionaceae bacterium]
MNDNRHGSNNSHLSSVGQYPEAAVIEHLKRCQKIAAEQSEDIFKHFMSSLDAKLLEFSDSAKTNQEVSRLQDTIREFRSKGKEFQRQFINHLADGFVKFKSKKLNTKTGEDKYKSDMLSLVDNSDLEETIAVSSVVHRADEQYSETLWYLNQRFAVLNGGETVSEPNNPISPIQFCESLRRALKVLSIDTKAKIITYKIFDKEFISRIGSVFAEMNQYLAREGILANLRYDAATARAQQANTSVDLPLPSFDEPTQGEPEYQQQSAAEVSLPMQQSSPFQSQPLPASSIVATPDATAPPGEYQGGLVDAIRVLQNHINTVTATSTPSGPQGLVANSSPPPQSFSNPQVSPENSAVASAGGAAAPGGMVATGSVYSNTQLVSALQNLQTQAFTSTAGLVDTPTGEMQAITPQTIEAVNQNLVNQLQEEADDGKVDDVDMHTIELVGMLFEYMLSDDHLPDSIKAILSYLHTPFLKVAFLDKTFFEKTEHPARLLLNDLAEAGTKWVSNDGTSQYEIYTKVKQVVSRVLEDFEKDVRLFAELLLEFSSYVKKISRRQDLMEKRVMEKVQGEEKLREVKMRVNKEVRSRTDGNELPSAVLLLLLQPWSDYLAFLLLRYGDQSDLWGKAIGAVDDLLWSIQAKTDPAEKARHEDMLDDLLDVIDSGFETIGYDQAKGKKLIEAIVSLQQMALQSQEIEAAPEPEREKLESMAAEKAGHPEEPLEEATPEEAKMVENLKMIEFGTWFEFDGGKRLKVAWYNSKTMHYMLVDQMGKKVAMQSGLELAKGMLSGATKVIAGSSKPFFERALENIFQNLNAKAEALSPEASSPEESQIEE